jgi:hypothetical protein
MNKLFRKVAAGVLVLFCSLGISRLAIAEDPVYFPDANLKAAVESALGISNPTPTDMLSLTSLTLQVSSMQRICRIWICSIIISATYQL